MTKTFIDVLRWKIMERSRRWPRWIENVARPALPPSLQSNEVALTFVNHATWLIQLDGLNVLTDPVWSERTSPLRWLGPKRVRPPGVAFQDLPPIHAVLVSHNHYDHMDRPTLEELQARHRPRFFVSLGDGPRLRRWGLENVSEMDWWQELPLDSQTHLIYTRTQHWSRRTFRDQDRSLWGGFVVARGEHRLYFGGDAGYSSAFAETFERYGAMDLALLPIGAYEPRWFMRGHHMNPSDAVKAHGDLRSRRSVGIHYGCWQLTDEGLDDPVIALKQARLQAGLDEESFSTLEVGETRRYLL